ncbi:MAG: TetR/AcrR family transcriptional regulator [Alphaproteobacteria bacterium]|nr:TetR/AcrR family transcriptional regulator [Alphaproteobacteria bacterium]
MDVALDTKTRIERAALKLFVKQGFAETSIKDIAREAGVSQGAMYNHFKSKEELSRDLFTRGYTGVGVALREAARRPTDFPTKLRAMIGIVYEHFDRDWELFSYCFRVRQQFLAKAGVGSLNPYVVFRTVIAEAMQTGAIPKRDADLMAMLVTGAIMQVVDARSLAGSSDGPLARQSEPVAAACARLLGSDRA